MIWVKLPELVLGTERAHWFAYCWSCQRNKFMPGMLLTTQLFVNPFIHTEPLCEKCARNSDPNFGSGAKLELINGVLNTTPGDEPECPHNKPKRYYHVNLQQLILACSYECAEKVAKKKEKDWKSFCERIGL